MSSFWSRIRAVMAQRPTVDPAHRLIAKATSKLEDDLELGMTISALIRESQEEFKAVPDNPTGSKRPKPSTLDNNPRLQLTLTRRT